MASNPAYEISKSVEDRQMSTNDYQGELIELSATDKTINNETVTGAAQEKLKKTKVSLVIGIALSTAVLALVVSVVSVGLSTAFNSKLEIQSLTTVVNDLQLSLNQSLKTIKDLGQRISALQTDTATQYGSLKKTSTNSIEALDQHISALQTNTTAQYGILKKTSTNSIEALGEQISALQTDTATQHGILNIAVNGIQNTIREHSDFLNKVNRTGEITKQAINDLNFQISFLQTNTSNILQARLKQSTNDIEVLGQQISALQTKTTAQYGIVNQTMNNLENTIREHSDFLNKVNRTGDITKQAINDLSFQISVLQTNTSNIIQASLNQSTNSIEALGQQISNLQTNTTAQYGIVNQTVNSIQDTIREHSDYLKKVNRTGEITKQAINDLSFQISVLQTNTSNILRAILNQSTNSIEALGQQISNLQTNTTAQYGIVNQTVNSIQDTIREHSDYLNKVNRTGEITKQAINDLSSKISVLQTNTSNILRASLNQSTNSIEDLGLQISALQTDTATQYGIVIQTVNSIQDTIHEHSDFLNKVNRTEDITKQAINDLSSKISFLQANTSNILQARLNQSTNDIEVLGQQISVLQTNTTAQYGIVNQTVNSIQDTIREHSDSLNKLNRTGDFRKQAINDLSFQISILLTNTSNILQASLNQSTNSIEVLGEQISSLQTDTATQYGILNVTVNGIQNTIREHSDLLNKLNPKGSITNPATSCSEIPTDRPSGEYWILRNSSSVLVYCDMIRSCCDTTGGWMRVANFDMTDCNQQCPDGFLEHNEATAPLRTCGKPGSGCVSTTFPVHGIEYSRVCGRVIGYQFGTPEAFFSYYDNRALTINDVYVDGVSLTHGKLPRKHIWTFACARDEVETDGSFICPCTRSDITYTGVVPPFIGQDYFCDTGSRNRYQFILFPDDPLWNGQGCGGTSTCCSFNNPPWFCKQLPQPTTDDIELRLCANYLISDEDMFLELADIFVQ